jgi:glycine/D-amino acid oxidase-like deaminating enzyme
MLSDLFAADVKLTPYWWDRTPRPVLPATELPQAVDVVVIGSGYTGLSTALVTARGGRKTLVLDAEDAGWGCSTRNGGQISTSIKPGYEELARRHGAETAFRIVKDGQNSLAWIGEFVAQERIDCDFQVVGRFHAAHGPRHYEALAERLRNQPKGLEIAAHLVPRAVQHEELGTEAYCGGVVYERHVSVDPARLHQGMLERVLSTGSDIVSNCRATRIRPNGRGFHVETVRGSIATRNVVVATNGYTSELIPWLRRRVIPIGSYIIATEPLSQETMRRLMPKNRVISDTRKVVYYYRASPDQTRILFGGRVSASEMDPRVTGPRLHAEMVRIFPELAGVRISHSWAGFVAYTFDELMHIGQHEGVHYAMGYCGSGVGMAGYLGMRVGQQVLGLPTGGTGLDATRFQTRPFYGGNPWFLAPAVTYYRWRDKVGA